MLKDIISTLMPLLVVLFANLFKNEQTLKAVKENKEELTSIKKLVKTNKNANLQSIRKQLKIECRKYLQFGNITYGELEDLTNLYESYAELGGNGNRKREYEKCIKLPIIERR